MPSPFARLLLPVPVLLMAAPGPSGLSPAQAAAAQSLGRAFDAYYDIHDTAGRGDPEYKAKWGAFQAALARAQAAQLPEDHAFFFKGGQPFLFKALVLWAPIWHRAADESAYYQASAAMRRPAVGAYRGILRPLGGGEGRPATLELKDSSFPEGLVSDSWWGRNLLALQEASGSLFLLEVNSGQCYGRLKGGELTLTMLKGPGDGQVFVGQRVK